ncbi:hypothetical protein PspLS_09883, partial [Pyricularia sp. CBS 133598]
FATGVYLSVCRWQRWAIDSEYASSDLQKPPPASVQPLKLYRPEMVATAKSSCMTRTYSPVLSRGEISVTISVHVLT